jgi:hypothetical protein
LCILGCGPADKNVNITASVLANRCVCNSAYTFLDGSCQCPSPATLSAGVCSCPAPNPIVNGICGGNGCASDPNMNSSTTPPNCACYTPYIWNTVTTTCVSCLQISNSRGINDTASCVCKTGYVWKSATFTCDVNCAIIPNTNGTVNGTFCSCNDTRFSFNPLTATCEITCKKSRKYKGSHVSPVQC